MLNSDTLVPPEDVFLIFLVKGAAQVGIKPFANGMKWKWTCKEIGSQKSQAIAGLCSPRVRSK